MEFVFVMSVAWVVCVIIAIGFCCAVGEDDIGGAIWCVTCFALSMTVAVGVVFISMKAFQSIF